MVALICLQNVSFYFFYLTWILASKFRCPPNWYIDLKSGLDQILLFNMQYFLQLYSQGQGLIQRSFNIGIPILGTLIWACPIFILSKTETTIKSNPSFLIITRKR